MRYTEARGLLLTVFEGCTVGRKRIQTFHDLTIGETYEEIKKLANDKRRWKDAPKPTEQQNTLYRK